MGVNFGKTLVKFAEPATYRDALREVEDRYNGKLFSPPFSPHLIQKSNFVIKQVEQVCEIRNPVKDQGCFEVSEVSKDGNLKT